MHRCFAPIVRQISSNQQDQLERLLQATVSESTIHFSLKKSQNRTQSLFLLVAHRSHRRQVKLPGVIRQSIFVHLGLNSLASICKRGIARLQLDETQTYFLLVLAVCEALRQLAVDMLRCGMLHAIKVDRRTVVVWRDITLVRRNHRAGSRAFLLRRCRLICRAVLVLCAGHYHHQSAMRTSHCTR